MIPKSNNPRKFKFFFNSMEVLSMFVYLCSIIKKEKGDTKGFPKNRKGNDEDVPKR